MSSPSHEEIEQLVSEANRVARDYGAMRATDEEVETAIDNLAVAAYRALDTHPQAPASPQPEAEAQKAVACDENELLADFYEASGTMVNGDQVFGTIRHNDLLQLIRAARDTTPSAGAPLPEQRQEAAQVEAHALAEEAKTAWGRQDPKRLWIAIEALEALATPPASSRVAAPTPQAVKVPLTDDELWRFWWSRPEVPDGGDDSMEAEFVKAVRAILAAHGIHPTEGERSHD